MRTGSTSGAPATGIKGYRRAGPPAGPAFTLVEILVVIVIIGILVAVAMTLATRVTQGGRARLTEDTIRVLDTAVEDYCASKDGAIPPYWNNTDNGLYFPFVDGRIHGTRPPTPQFDINADYSQPTTTFFLGLCKEVPTADAACKQIDAKLLERREFPNQLKAWGWATTGAGGNPGGGGGNIAVRSLTAPVVKDAFGHPIRMVHPKFDGGFDAYFDGASQTMVQFSSRQPMIIIPPQGSSLPLMNPAAFSRSYKPFDPRSTPDGTPVGDADEGICPGGRPYFYSAGPDGDPGTRNDNIYTTRPEWPSEKSKQLE
jgi:prepilin-type N-terminal cleavage/methylation domain-containing protein